MLHFWGLSRDSLAILQAHGPEEHINNFLTLPNQLGQSRQKVHV